MSDFQYFISNVASRLRHDLKGGLISLRLGLEAISDDEALKPLLLERAQAMETLADKLILLLRMGELNQGGQRLSAVLGEARRRVQERFSDLEVVIATENNDDRWVIDGDALVYALYELAENSALAKATKFSIAQSGAQIVVSDNGEGAHAEDRDNPGGLCELGLSRWDRSGLGLSVAQQCAVGHGGELSVESLEDGLKVVFDFPAGVLG